MEQRDYLMRQIEQLGQVLARALARILNIKQVPDGGLSIDEIREVFSDELDITLDIILETPKDEVVGILQSRIKFIDHHLDKMAELLAETAELYRNTEEAPIAQDLREKAIVIYEYLQDSSGAYSLDRVMRITRLKELL